MTQLKDVYFDKFSSADDVEKEFEAPGCLKDAEALFAYYSYEDYQGSALVVFTREGKLYEVNGSHCSCRGLEGQWSPEETTLQFLYQRFCTENSDSYVFRDSDTGAKKALQHLIENAYLNKIIME